MLKVIRDLLLKVVDSIDVGNSNISEKEAFEIIDIIKRYTDTTQYYNRTQAAKYLNCSVQSFDLYRKEGNSLNESIRDKIYFLSLFYLYYFIYIILFIMFCLY